MNNSCIQRVVELAPLLKEALGEEYAVTVTDTDYFIWYAPGVDLNHNIKPGDPIVPGAVSCRCLKTGKRIVTTAGPETYGVPYMGKVTPVRDENGVVVGTVGFWLPITLVNKVRRMSDKMVSAVGHILSYATNLSAAAEELASTVQNINSNTLDIMNDVNNTNSILQLINEVSSQTHLLGLNAAIEAARAGDNGRGFNVVAEEIRKLANRTNTSVKDIRDIISVIQNHVEALAAQISDVSAVTEEQASSSNDITGFIEQLDEITSELKDLSDELVHKL